MKQDHGVVPKAKQNAHYPPMRYISPYLPYAIPDRSAERKANRPSNLHRPDVRTDQFCLYLRKRPYPFTHRLGAALGREELRRNDFLRLCHHMYLFWCARSSRCIELTITFTEGSPLSTIVYSTNPQRPAQGTTPQLPPLRVVAVPRILRQPFLDRRQPNRKYAEVLDRTRTESWGAARNGYAVIYQTQRAALKTPFFRRLTSQSIGSH